MEADDYLRTKLARVERDKAVAESKVDECRTKAVEYENRVRELDIVLKHLRQWAAEADGSAVTVGATPEAGAMPIRALVREFLRANREFASAQLVAAILTRNPSAKEPSIRAELSHAKKRGDVTMFDKDHYRSGSYVSLGDTQHEPGDDFGRLVP